MGLKGGEKLIAYLTNLKKNVNNQPTLDVGFFSGSVEENSNIPTAAVAYFNEFGGASPDGTLNRPPSRPFFRSMIASGKPHWGSDLASYLVTYNFSVDLALKKMGERMVEELQDSIIAPGYLPDAKSTIKHKGHSDTLRDTGSMLHAVTFEIKNESA